MMPKKLNNTLDLVRTIDRLRPGNDLEFDVEGPVWPTGSLQPDLRQPVVTVWMKRWEQRGESAKVVVRWTGEDQFSVEPHARPLCWCDACELDAAIEEWPPATNTGIDDLAEVILRVIDHIWECPHRDDAAGNHDDDCEFGI